MNLIPVNTPDNPGDLITQIGCNTCHSGLPGSNTIRTKAPDLSYAGLRYNPAYLFEYLQNPARVRHHIGLARMPNFNFSPEESLALTKFLRTQKTIDGEWPEFPDLDRFRLSLSGKEARVERGRKVLDQMACLTCHSLRDEGSMLVSDLSNSRSKLNPDWLRNFLAAPFVYGGRENLMPSYFYQLSPDSSRLDQIRPDAPDMINDLVVYLTSLNEERKTEMESVYENFASQNTDITKEMGQKIFQGQNCAACHRTTVEGMWKEKTAPDLSNEASRVKPSWLSTFLKKPYPVRPFGYFPGSGGRMPDFHLTVQEVTLIAEYLHSEPTPIDTIQPVKLSAFSMAKTEKLLRDKLSCLGCHQLGDKGGRIGPDLTNLNSRLNQAYINKIIREPHKLIPGTVMPKIPMPPETLDLVAGYLLQKEFVKEDTEYLSLTDHVLIIPNGDDDPDKGSYLKYCAMCHGFDGHGDGFNARFMPNAPTIHADASYMSLRPDDVLFDGIYAGGYILNKSNLMPPWGHTLENDEMLGLVKYMRKLCDCVGPEWSRDNQSSPD